jgi:hypothetical protein
MRISESFEADEFMSDRLGWAIDYAALAAWALRWAWAIAAFPEC